MAKKIKHTLVDEDKGVTYFVLAGRKLTDEEVLSAVRGALRLILKSRHPKRGESFTIHSVIEEGD